MSNSILSVGSHGLQQGLARADKAAAGIARAGATGGDITTPIVDLKASEQQVKASAAVVRTAEDVIGTLINIKA